MLVKNGTEWKHAKVEEDHKTLPISALEISPFLNTPDVGRGGGKRGARGDGGGDQHYTFFREWASKSGLVEGRLVEIKKRERKKFLYQIPEG